MTKTTKNSMVRIKRKLKKVVGMWMTACGHEENVAEAQWQEWELLEMIQAAIEKGGND